MTTLPDPLSEARRCIDRDPARAAALTRALPGPQARLILGGALRRLGDLAGATNVLAPLASASPGAWGVQFELGLTLAARGRAAAATAALARASALNPGSLLVRHALAATHFHFDDDGPALAEADRLVAAQPGNPAFRTLRGAVRLHRGDASGAATDLEAAVAAAPGDAGPLLALGHARRAAGERDAAIAAYRGAAALRPGFGEAWWSLANLKVWRFEPGDIAQMEAALATARGLDASYLGFALGKAAEDAGDAAAAFAHYARANAVRRPTERWDADAADALLARVRRIFDAPLLTARAGAVAPEPGPIFIVGMPRSGSTLVEQILSSHSQVEGASELPDLPALIRGLDYPEGVPALPDAALAALGRAYLDRTRHRRGGKPFLVDKLPGNFVHIGLIALALPGARIVDVRRGAMDCCCSLFRHAFATGQGYAYDLTDLGRAYAGYAETMAHYETVLPGRIIRVEYEALVAAPEAGTRALLAALGLAFEPECLDFHRTARVIRTPSSEQVRRPIGPDGIGQWRPFAPWLGPLQAALGPALAADNA